MTSVRYQILDAVEDKLTAAVENLGWKTFERDPREPFGEDQMNAIALGSGGDDEPELLTGGVEPHVMEFSVGLVVIEGADKKAEQLLDDGFVAVCNALIDPADIQLGGLAADIRRGALSPPFIGRSKNGARIVGVQEIGFFVSYWVREGDVSTPAP